MAHECNADYTFSDYIALDSGATFSCTAYGEFVDDLDVSAAPVTIVAANGGTMKSVGRGHVGDHIHDIVYLPSIRVDLLSVIALSRRGYKCEFGPTHSRIYQGSRLVSQGIMKSNLYLHKKTDFKPSFSFGRHHSLREQVLEISTRNQSKTGKTDGNTHVLGRRTIVYPECQDVTPRPITLKLHSAAKQIMAYHCRAGHIGYHKLLMQTKLGLVNGLKFTLDDVLKLGKIDCHICIMSKLQRLPRYLSTSERPKPIPGTYWSVDIKPKLPSTLTNMSLCFSWVDHGSGMTFHDPRKLKSEIVDSFNTLRTFGLAHQQIQPGYNMKPGILHVHSDDEAVLTSGRFHDLLEELNIKHTSASPYVHEQTGLIESAIKTDFTTARALLIHAGVKPYLWDHALRHVSHTRFVTITSKGIGEPLKTPFEHWYGYKPDVSYLRQFGAASYHIINKPDKDSTFDPNAQLGIMVGYTANKKVTYDILELKSPYHVTPRADVWFKERLPSDDPLRDTRFYKGEEYNESILIGPKHPGESFVEYFSPEDEDKAEFGDQPTPACIVVDHDDHLADLVGRPQLYIHQVLRHPAKQQFIQALMEEWEAHDKAGTFEYISDPNFQLPEDAQVINLQANFRVGPVKDNPSKLKVKGRASGRGDQLPKGRKAPSFSPTVPRHHLRLLYACAAQFRWKKRKFDIVTAYLAALLEDLVYFRVPPSIARPGYPRFGRIIKALYGLPESGRLFNKHLDKMLKSKGYRPLDCDPCIYIKICADGKIIIAVYVDDMAAFATSDELIFTILLPDMQSIFNIKDEGDLTRMLSVDIHHDYDTDTITLSQMSYVEHIVNEFNVTHHRPNPSVMEPTHEPGTALTKMPTSILQRVGCLRYLCDNSRPDLLFATGRAATDPTGQRAQHALEYLAATSSYSLKYRRSANGLHIMGYSDASFKQKPNASSFYGTTVFINDLSGCVMSRSKRIKTQVPQHIVEAEIYAACELAKDVLEITYFLREIDVPFTTPAILYTDSTGTIANIEEHQYRPLNRHMEPRLQGLRKWYEDGLFVTKHVASQDNLADFFTKVVTDNQHFYRSAQCNLGILNQEHPTDTHEQPTTNIVLTIQHVDDTVFISTSTSTLNEINDTSVVVTNEVSNHPDEEVDYDDMPPLVPGWTPSTGGMPC